VLFFSLTGDYIKESKQNLPCTGGQTTANGVIARDRITENDFQYNTIWLYDQNLRKTKEITAAPFSGNTKKAAINVTPSK